MFQYTTSICGCKGRFARAFPDAHAANSQFPVPIHAALEQKRISDAIFTWICYDIIVHAALRQERILPVLRMQNQQILLLLRYPSEFSVPEIPAMNRSIAYLS